MTPPLADGLIEDAKAAAAIAFAYEGDSTFRAGELSRWTLRFTARIDLPPRARIAVAHRWPNDWGIAQGSDPSAIDYLEVRASDARSVRWWSARLATWHPFDHVLTVELPEGLPKGQSVALRYGEGAGGSPGYRAQTFIEEGSPFSLRWQEVEGGPWVEFARHTVVVVGTAPAKLVVTAPSRVRAGAPFSLHVRAEDGWGNPARLDEPVVLEGVDKTAPVHIPEAGWTRVQVALKGEGIRRIEARSQGPRAFAATSNPIDVQPRAVAPLFWADLHGQSLIGCGARTIDAYYAHARDFAAADAASHQANCFLVSNPEWERTTASTRAHHEPGRFVTLLGVEWSGAPSVGGDHNLYFPGDEAPLRRCSHEFLVDRSDADTDLRHVEDVYRHYDGTDTLIAVHVGGRTADLGWHAPELDRLIEVHSTHATSEWFLFDALRRGYRMGVIAGSDGVDGRPGNSHPGHLGVRNVRGGLTAILATALTREAVWEALKARRCYATTGERILLDFSAGRARMGDIVAADAVAGGFDVRIEGSAPLERIDFFRGTQCLQSVDCFAEAGAASQRVRVAWKGASAPGNWQLARMDWEGGLRIAGARIVDVEGWAFDTPDEGVVAHDSASVRWRSITAGDWDGVILTLDRVEGAELAFVTGPMNVRTRLDTLAPQGRTFDAHHPERALEVRRLPQRMPATSFAGHFVDREPAPGAHAYWVRVRQADGAQAWSTPIFVDAAQRA